MVRDDQNHAREISFSVLLYLARLMPEAPIKQFPRHIHSEQQQQQQIEEMQAENQQLQQELQEMRAENEQLREVNRQLYWELQDVQLQQGHRQVEEDEDEKDEDGDQCP